MRRQLHRDVYIRCNRNSQHQLVHDYKFVRLNFMAAKYAVLTNVYGLYARL